MIKIGIAALAVLTLLLTVLTTLKLAGAIAWSWGIVLLPLWVILVILICAALFLLAFGLTFKP